MSPSESMTDNIYLDNAATSHPKPEAVYQQTLKTLRCGGNAGRGSYDTSMAAERLIFRAREALADFFSVADSSCFVFDQYAMPFPLIYPKNPPVWLYYQVYAEFAALNPQLNLE